MDRSGLLGLSGSPYGVHSGPQPRYPLPRKSPKPSSISQQQTQGSVWFGALCANKDVVTDILGVIVVTGALLVYGLLQERIMTFGFGARGEVFEHSIFLVLCNRLVTVVLAGAYLLASRTATAPAAPLMSYAAVSMTNVIATACQYEALRYVSFAVQTLAKSAKALPVMLWSGVYMRKRYRLSEYLHAASITAGCCVFILTGHVHSRVAHHAAGAAATAAAAAAVASGATGTAAAAGGGGGVAAGISSLARGLLWGASTSGAAGAVVGGGSGGGRLLLFAGGGLMALYLLVDGLTSTWQDAMFKGYAVNVCDQVLYTTCFSMLLSLVGCIATQQLVPALAFLARNPDAILWITALSVASAAVQLVISWTIKRYGAVVFATIMTTRQFFSILLSSVVFMTPLTAGQWAGTVIVFGAIYYKALQRCRERQQLHAMHASWREDDFRCGDTCPEKAPLLHPPEHRSASASSASASASASGSSLLPLQTSADIRGSRGALGGGAEERRITSEQQV
ncbi:hypothetical protein Agub_g10807 [Astrephomene gubernaculifera]|uniref:Uncharacterized protein n=1 Tax=Astrephomene gubernaculifera TaxID=47775 RepID=A0AAD3DVY1_9CHLO|nr:hypothetical protein Agub_g10807 [Astrephomene gubernaculifera]